ALGPVGKRRARHAREGGRVAALDAVAGVPVVAVAVGGAPGGDALATDADVPAAARRAVRRRRARHAREVRRVAGLLTVAGVPVVALGVGPALGHDALAVEADLVARAADLTVRDVRARHADEAHRVAGLLTVARIRVVAV